MAKLTLLLLKKTGFRIILLIYLPRIGLYSVGADNHSLLYNTLPPCFVTKVRLSSRFSFSQIKIMTFFVLLNAVSHRVMTNYRKIENQSHLSK